ncbi:hypothetical protein N5K32_004572 [Vibrio parahaemolyticus]|nr:hypothetical protein [Vibrio parahaemolyticus]EHZ2751590.1 hypothetical protein [Vibrio parahaemolyticus]EJG2012265.1 hypothetical protein [Vibrio parahaemolyticus]EJK2411001.1 hypothetical protein [Vibrio parahaemolyticus]EJU8968712.1 hypothetical protein [Vibrio parahaemolyticus]
MEILDLIKEPIFLIASTVMSIVISVAANLVTPKIQKVLSFFFASIKVKQAEKRQAYVSKIVLASTDENKVINIKLDVSYALLKSLIIFVFSLFLLSVSPYIFFAEYPVILISLFLVTYALSLFNSAQAKFKIATLATLRAEKMASLKADIDAASCSEHDYYAQGYVDPHEEMYMTYLSEWDSKHL